MADDGYTHEVIQAVKRPVHVEVDGKYMPFGRDGAFRVKDPGVAAEISAKYGGKEGDVTVTKVKYPHVADRGHKYFFSVPELPWHKDTGDNDERRSGSSASAKDTAGVLGEV